MLLGIEHGIVSCFSLHIFSAFRPYYSSSINLKSTFVR